MEQVVEIMSGTDLGVVPKRKDSFGNEAFSTKIMEFMAMSVPVVASRTRIDEYYFSDNLLQFFESGNAQDLAEKIYALIGDPDRRNALRACSSEFIVRNSWDVKKQDYLNMIDRLAA
jgi:glycosyltransferase involved in cell wall biosynthesis